MALVVGVISLALEYRDWRALVAKERARIEAQVILQYQKRDERGERVVLKLRHALGWSFYTTSKESLQDLTFRYVRLTILPSKVSFIDYLRGFYAPSFGMALLPERDYKESLRAFIDNQHTTPLAGNLYRTLFLADPLAKPLREGAVGLGISHLLAISGFHLGVLSALLGALCLPLYRYFQARFFPYRNAYYDLGALTLLLASFYLVILGDSPSFVRALAMALWGYFLLHRGVAILSFSSLLAVGVGVVALFPRLVFSVGFFLSMMGVFLIFLHLHHTKAWNRWLNFFTLNLALYILMLIPVHSFFPPFSPFQLLSVPLTILFTLFYPLALGAHTLGLGGIGEGWILQALLVEYPRIELHASAPWAIAYGVLALLAVRYKVAYGALVLLSSVFFLQGIYLFLR